MTTHRLILAALLLIAVGCRTTPSSQGMTDADPAVRIPAIKAQVALGARADRRALVEQLDHDDPAVRLAAIEALRRLENTTYGYRWFDPAETRKPAVDRWRQAVGLEPNAPADRSDGQPTVRP